MANIKLPSIEEGRNIEETIKNLFDAMYKFKKELEFLLVNIDSANLNNVDGVKGVLADPQKPRIEDVQDIIASTLKEGTGINIEYDDSTGLINISINSVEGISGLLADAQHPIVEDVQDIVNNTLVAGNGIGIVYDDVNNTLTISLDTETVQDIMNDTLVAGDGIDVVYDDNTGNITISLKDITESVQDIINSTIIAGKGIKGTYDDENNTYTIDTDIDSVNEPPAFNVQDGDIEVLTISDPPTQAEVQALRDKCEMLADDCRALRQTVANLISALKT